METTTEERETRKSFWLSIPRHSPPVMYDFESRLLQDFDHLWELLEGIRLGLTGEPKLSPDEVIWAIDNELLDE
jgi:hypothetical protein